MKKSYHFLYPGQLYVGKHPCAIRTILGSCVAVTLVDRRAMVIGLCHYLLDKPLRGERGNCRYGSTAIAALIAEMQNQGSTIRDMEAGIIGGANLSTNLSSFHDEIGFANVKIAREMIRAQGIRVVFEDVGGSFGRNIVLSSQTFDVQSVTIQKSAGKDLEKTGFSGPEMAQSARVLLVDDSQTARAVIEKSLSKARGIEVVGTAADAFEARDKIVRLKPDVVLLDIEMPRMNGVDFLEKIMRHNPMPVIMVSSLSPDGKAALRALELGAVEFVQKPSQYDPNLLRDLSEILPAKVLAAASTKNHLMKSREPSKMQVPASIDAVSKPNRRSSTVPSTMSSLRRALELICISGNVGSLDSLKKILSGLEDDSPPIVLAVSIASAVPAAFIQKMNGQTPLMIVPVDRPVTMSRGKVYLGTSEKHLSVSSGLGGSLIVEPSAGPAVQGQRPSGDVLMMSAAKASQGSLCGILLGGFGKDGIRGLDAVLSSGGSTIVESPDSAAFPHTIQAALQNGSAQECLDADDIAMAIFRQRSGTGS